MGSIIVPIKDIIARIETDGAAKYVRIWNNQIEDILAGNYEGMLFPAIFVESENGNNFKNIGMGVKSSDCAFRLHLVVDEYDAQTGRMGENQNVFDFKDQIMQLMEYWAPLQCGPLMNAHEQQDTRHSNVYHYMIDFITTFVDDTSYMGRNNETVNPPIAIEIDVIEDLTLEPNTPQQFNHGTN